MSYPVHHPSLRTRWFMAAFAAIQLLLPGLTWGGHGANPTPVGQWPGIQRGNALAVAVTDTQAYLATGPAGLIILNITNPATPIPVGTYADTESYGVVVANNLAFVAAGRNGLRILDVSNPKSPQPAGNLITGDFIVDVAINANHAFLAAQSGGFLAVDVANPKSPILIGSYKTTDAVSGFAIAGARAFITANSAGLEVLDISNPSTPVLKGTYKPAANPVGVALSGNIAYLAVEGTGLEIVDIANPSMPVKMAELPTDSPFGISVLDHLVVLSDGPAGLKLIDATAPSAPKLLGEMPTSDAMHGAALGGQLAYIAEDDLGLRIVNISKPAAPTTLGLHALGESLGVAIAGHYAYVAEGDAGIQILDIQDPTAPIAVGRFQTDDLAFGVALSGNHLFVAADEGGLEVLDVKNPTLPVRVGRFATDDYVSQVVIAGSLAFLVADDAGLLILNVANPATPTLVGKYLPAQDPLAVAVAGTLAYLVTESSRIVILDVSDPANPTVLSEYTSRGAAQDVALNGRFAYIAVGADGLEVLDVSRPIAPISVGHYNTPGYVTGVTVSGDHAFLASTTSGLEILDISNPAAPVLLPGLATPGYAHQVAVTGDYAFVANDNWGIAVIRVLPTPSERLRISWPGGKDEFILESTSDPSGSWLPSLAPVIETNGRQQVTLHPSDGALFSRLNGGFGRARPLEAPISLPESRDRGVTVSADELTMIFFSNRNGHDDLYTITRVTKNSPWSSPTGMDTLNTPSDEAFPSLSADGLSLFFADRFSLPTTRRENLGASDLWVSTRADVKSPWRTAVHLGGTVNGPANDTMPFITSDGRTLLFASSDRPGNIQSGRGGRFDIWMTTREDPTNPTGWGTPVNLGASVNTAANETSPFLTSDGLTLYFASDRETPVHGFGPAGPGRIQTLNNLWVARRKSTSDPFGPATNLGVHLQYLHTLIDPHLSPDGSTLYFSTTGLLNGATPFADIWEVPLLEVKPAELKIERFTK